MLIQSRPQKNPRGFLRAGQLSPLTTGERGLTHLQVPLAGAAIRGAISSASLRQQQTTPAAHSSKSNSSCRNLSNKTPFWSRKSLFGMQVSRLRTEANCPPPTGLELSPVRISQAAGLSQTATATDANQITSVTNGCRSVHTGEAVTFTSLLGATHQISEHELFWRDWNPFEGLIPLESKPRRSLILIPVLLRL